MRFNRKDYGRIFVEKEEDIEKIKAIIKEMDPEEYEWYLPSDLITVFNKEDYKVYKDKSIGTSSTTYTHKFTDIDIGILLIKAWAQDIKCFALFGRYGHACFE